jgi:hypothetical protein
LLDEPVHARDEQVAFGVHRLTGLEEAQTQK